MKRIGIIVGAVVVAAFITYWYGLFTGSPIQQGANPILNTLRGDSAATSAPNTTIELVASGLTVPWSIAWTDQSRMLIAERTGAIRVFDGTLNPTPLLVVSDVATGDEEGLMGLVVDPEYETNRYVYYCYAYADGQTLKDRVVRAIDQGDRLSNAQTLLEDIPAAQFHAGCSLAFGPDNKLYITTGDATDAQMAQDLQSLAGKILRINRDGTIPTDNPFPGSPVWSYGHRNPQGIAWHPTTGDLFSTEHGPSGWDGPGGGDEINVIEKGANYGWPLVSHSQKRDGTISPLTTYTPAQAPGSAAFYDGDVLPQYQGALLFGALKGESLHAVHITRDTPATIATDEQIVTGYGRIRAVAVGPDGYIYFSTSNQDGRGTPQDGDDRILRIVPAN